MKTIKILANRIMCFIVKYNDEILWGIENLTDMYDLVLYIVNVLLS